jgi:hypothetical protein
LGEEGTLTTSQKAVSVSLKEIMGAASYRTLSTLYETC